MLANLHLVSKSSPQISPSHNMENQIGSYVVVYILAMMTYCDVIKNAFTITKPYYFAFIDCSKTT